MSADPDPEVEDTPRLRFDVLFNSEPFEGSDFIEQLDVEESSRDEARLSASFCCPKDSKDALRISFLRTGGVRIEGGR